MTNHAMSHEIERTAQAEKDAGAEVSINWNLPSVHIVRSDGQEFYFQGQEASELLDQHRKSAQKFGVSESDSILHAIVGW